MNQVATVVTTINPPTDDLVHLAALSTKHQSRLFVVGDKKSPDGWELEGAAFSSYEQQISDSRFGVFAAELPANHYSRKNIGYLYAAASGADWIFETDDDNKIYEKSFHAPSLTPPLDSLEFSSGWVNVLEVFRLDESKCVKEKIWPRGFPLELINGPAAEPAVSQGASEVRTPVVQGLVDGDPDVDAIFRMTRQLPKYFVPNDQTVVLHDQAFCPFNSQNTWWHVSTLPLMYLPISTSFRVTDILRSYVAQAILKAMGMGIAFTGATAIQNRNVHDFHSDFVQEVPLYEDAAKMMTVLSEAVSDCVDIEDALLSAYQALYSINAVDESEITTLRVWLNSCSIARSSL